LSQMALVHLGGDVHTRDDEINLAGKAKDWNVDGRGAKMELAVRDGIAIAPDLAQGGDEALRVGDGVRGKGRNARCDAPVPLRFVFVGEEASTMRANRLVRWLALGNAQPREASVSSGRFGLGDVDETTIPTLDQRGSEASCGRKAFDLSRCA